MTLAFGTAVTSLIGCLPARTGTTKLATAPLALASGMIGNLSQIAATDVKADIPVFLVCGRNLLDSPDGVNPFGNERSTAPTPHLAIAKVAVGEGLSRERIIRETLSPEPGKKKTRFELKEIKVLPPLDVDHFSLGDSEIKHSDHEWVATIRERLAAGRNQTITIYVHGFNTHLINNTEFAAGMAHFEGREGAVVSYEWPSLGNITAYLADQGNANFSTRVFRGLVANIARETGASRINIIAHSAGSPIVVNALKELRLINQELSPAELHEKFKISRVALAAPDMDLMGFFNGVFDRFHEITEGVAVYASPRDKALDIAEDLFKAERLGKAVEGLEAWERDVLINVSEIEIIDVGVPESFSKGGLGHSYFYRDPWVSSDIIAFMQGLSPAQRHLLRNQGAIFWEFPRNYPDLVSNF